MDTEMPAAAMSAASPAPQPPPAPTSTGRPGRPATQTLTLPSGRIAVVTRGKGSHLRNGMRIARDPADVPFAILAQLVTVDGEPVTLEELLELDMGDAALLLARGLDGVPL